MAIIEERRTGFIFLEADWGCTNYIDTRINFNFWYSFGKIWLTYIKNKSH